MTTATGTREIRDFDLTSSAFKRDPHPTLNAIREAGPVVRVKLPMLGEIWMATTYDAVQRVLRDTEVFVMEPRHAGKKGHTFLRWMPRSFRVLLENMLQKDEPDHRRLRGIVDQAFARQSVEGMRPAIEGLVDHQLDLLEAEAERSRHGIVDFMEHFARPFPLAVICELLGLPADDRPKFKRWASALTTATSVSGMLWGLPGLWRISAYFRRRFDLCRRDPQPGLLSDFVNASHEGRTMSEDELLAMAFLMLFAGHETTVHLVTGGLVEFLRQPAARATLESDWSRAELAVDEVLRYVCPIQMTKPRMPREDVEFLGTQLKQGEYVMALLAAANLDPARFDDPETFDVHRSPNPHVGFGGGIHVCLGNKLARTETAIAYERILTRFPQIEIARPESELEWVERPGSLSRKSLPVRLG
jgi:cytochrome P450